MSIDNRDELLDTLIDVLWQACEHRESDDEQIGHRFLSSYERGFDALEEAGRLKYTQPVKRYWARVTWSEKAGA